MAGLCNLEPGAKAGLGGMVTLGNLQCQSLSAQHFRTLKEKLRTASLNITLMVSF